MAATMSSAEQKKGWGTSEWLPEFSEVLL